MKNGDTFEPPSIQKNNNAINAPYIEIFCIWGSRNIKRFRPRNIFFLGFSGLGSYAHENKIIGKNFNIFRKHGA